MAETDGFGVAQAGTGEAAAVGGAAVVGVVGFGRAGRAVAAGLAVAGQRVVVYSSSAGRAGSAPWPRVLVLARASSTGMRLAESLEALTASCDVVVCAVPDGAIGPVAAGLAASGRLGDRHVVVHLSGRHGLGVLDAVRTVGAARGAIHPVMTLSGHDDDARLLAGTPFGVTADPAAAAVIAGLVAAVGGRVVQVADEARATYHAGIVLAANFLGTLVNSAVDVLAAAGIADGGALLGPLLRTSLDNALRSGDAAATGPVRRADTETLAAHLSALGEAAPWVVDTYVRLASLTALRLERSGQLDEADSAAVRAVLGNDTVRNRRTG